MATTISGSTGVTFPAGGTGNPSSTVVGINDTQTLTNKTLASPAIVGTPAMGASVITSGTLQNSTSGTSIDFTSIPSWVKRITVMFNGVSTTGTSSVQIQLGDADGVETSGYSGTAGAISASGAASALLAGDGFSFSDNGSAASTRVGSVTITLISASTNTWALSGSLAKSDATRIMTTAGVKSLSATLDRVRITTVDGTNTFDAGSINILYE